MKIESIKKNVEEFENNNKELVNQIERKVVEEVREFCEEKGIQLRKVRIDFWKGQIDLFLGKDERAVTYHTFSDSYEICGTNYKKDIVNALVEIVEDIVIPYFNGEKG